MHLNFIYMELNKNYNPALIESKWYEEWMDQKIFKSVPDGREPYTIVIPPPNVTGVLHMGHMLNNTLQDVMIRHARMQGKNACWVPGTDHASIATETKVVNLLKDKNITKADISREEFLEHAWDWTHKHGGVILEQLKKLGASLDWDRLCFTMDEKLSASVIRVFIDLYNKGYIYRGHRMVNWDPQARTALSDEEVIYKEVQSRLYYVRYFIEGNENDFITIATTRPETILGDSAVCVHPEDKRYEHLQGKKLLVPLIKRPVPVIFDEYVDREFGTGALKITPAHDVNDYTLGLKYNLEFIDIFNEDATLNDKAILYTGKNRFEARKLIVKDLEQKGYIVKIEDYANNIGFSQRTDEMIEPRISLQWFLKMEDLVKPAIEHVANNDIRFYPSKFKNAYSHWVENIKDWCISRQLWWGHRIPAFYLADGSVFVAETINEALEIAKIQTGNANLKINDLKQDEDVLDTWFSSWLWPVSVFDGIRNPDNPDINYYYPTSDLITAPDIIFFWVARMIISGYEYRKDKPFQNVYFTGMVRDKLHRKMSKSLGNSPDPIELMGKFGADGVRLGMLFSSPAGNDLLFDESLCEQGRNFNNKIWNAFRLIRQWKTSDSTDQPEHNEIAVNWFESCLNRTIETIEDHFTKYRISDALMSVYKLFWDDFSSWYLEIIKPPFGEAIDNHTYNKTIYFFEKLLHLLHPFVPFITEELWHQTGNRGKHEFIAISKWPESKPYDKTTLHVFDQTTKIITAIRDFRKNQNMQPKEKIKIYFRSEIYHPRYDEIIIKLCNLEEFTEIYEKPDHVISFIVHSIEYFIPVTEEIDVDAEIQKFEKELEYYKGFLAIVMKKLDNGNFIKNAPEKVIEAEEKKKNDAEIKIQLLEDQIRSLKENK